MGPKNFNPASCASPASNNSKCTRNYASGIQCLGEFQDEERPPRPGRNGFGHSGAGDHARTVGIIVVMFVVDSQSAILALSGEKFSRIGKCSGDGSLVA